MWNHLFEADVCSGTETVQLWRKYFSLFIQYFSLNFLLSLFVDDPDFFHLTAY